jgi:beta-glucanase (GH16 family)
MFYEFYYYNQQLTFFVIICIWLSHRKTKNQDRESEYQGAPVETENQTKILISTALLFIVSGLYYPVAAQPSYENYRLVWSDEFNGSGLPDSRNWSYEEGYVRNNELQYYTRQRQENVRMENGNLIIEARRDNWNGNEYTSASLYSRGKQEFQYGIFEMRARIDVRQGSWPAFWTLGVSGEWPSNGEIDIMEYYAGKLHANLCWGSKERWKGIWSSKTRDAGSDFAEDFHIWRMLWTKDEVQLWVDDFLQNATDLKITINESDGKNPFHQKAYIMLNQAIGSNGGDPSGTTFPIQYLIDYVRVYQEFDTIPPAVVDAAASEDGTVSILFSEELDKSSSESVSNFTIEGHSISSAALQIDSRTVVLKVSGLSAGEEIILTIKGIKDDSEAANTIAQVTRKLTVAPKSVKLTGTVIGDGDPWNNTVGVEYDAAVDGNTSTYSDCVGETVWVGYDFGAGNSMIITGFRYYPRTGYADRMRGRTVEVSSDGVNWEKVYTIPRIPEENKFTTVPIIHSASVRFVRYNGTGGYLNVSEIEFTGYQYVSTSAGKSDLTGINPALYSDGACRFSLYTLSGRLLESRVLSSAGSFRDVLGELRRRQGRSSSQGLYIVTLESIGNRNTILRKVIKR